MSANAAAETNFIGIVHSNFADVPERQDFGAFVRRQGIKLD